MERSVRIAHFVALVSLLQRKKELNVLMDAQMVINYQTKVNVLMQFAKKEQYSSKTKVVFHALPTVNSVSLIHLEMFNVKNAKLDLIAQMANVFYKITAQQVV